MLLTPAEIKRKSFESRRNSSFARGGCASSLRACLGARLLLQSCQYPNLSEGADRVGGQLRGVKECPFSGGTKSGRVWRKVPESDARSVISTHTPAEVTSVFTVMSERRSPVCYTGLYCLALPACCPERTQSVLYTWTLP